MPVLYLALAFHAAFLAPLDYWTQPVGVLLAGLIAAGSVASVRVLAGRIGQDRRVGGVVESVRDAGAGVTEVVCRLDEGWRGHRPGQFAFATFDRLEGAHPFTIAGADRGDRRVRFQIKALGDYTRGLAQRLQPGRPMQVEGPYGCFDLPQSLDGREQIWIAGGIGVTPSSPGSRRCRRGRRRRPTSISTTACASMRPTPSSPASRPCAQTCPRCACT